MAVIIDIRYCAEWDDGFGARGWKLESTIADSRVIASTAFTGEISETSVFVHDIVDHYLCGLKIGGHRNEVIAVFLHALRSGVPIDSSIALMVEDLITTGECGEELETFLPDHMLHGTKLPATDSISLMEKIASRYGKQETYHQLIEHYYRIGAEGIPDALSAWSAHGLDNARRSAIGRCLQKLIRDADSHVQDKGISMARGQIRVGNTKCRIMTRTGEWHRPVIT